MDRVRNIELRRLRHVELVNVMSILDNGFAVCHMEIPSDFVDTHEPRDATSFAWFDGSEGVGAVAQALH